MLVHVEVNGRPRAVTVDRQDGVLTVTIDGEARRMDAARVDATTLSLVVLGDRSASHLIGFINGGSADQAVLVDGVPVPAALAMRRRHRGGAADRGGPGIQTVLAPMPGKVVRVLVSAGDRVEPRQPVVVVEAMKMENELRAPKAGIVSQVMVEPGTSVEAGAVLVVID